MVKIQPPLALELRYRGGRMRMAKSRGLLKVSEPAPSAGRGAFLMAGDCKTNCVSDLLNLEQFYKVYCILRKSIEQLKAN